MSAHVLTAEPIFSRSRITKLFALLVGFAVLCFGVVVGGVSPAHAAGQTVSGTIAFPTSAPPEVRQALNMDEDYEKRSGVYLTVYKDQPGTVEGWELGVDDEVDYNPQTGAWSVSNVPNGDYRITINAWLPGGGSAPGVNDTFTVNNADVAIDTVSITESGRLRVSIGLCGWEQGDQVEHFIKNTTTNTVYQLEPAQSGDSSPIQLCAPSPSTGIGNWMLPASGIAAGNYIAYTVWNGNTHYYTGNDSLASANSNDASVVPVALWTGQSITSIVPQQVSSGVLTIAGTAKVGQTLTANATGWTTGTAFTYQWLRGSTPISGATGKTYVLTPADAGQNVAVKATGTKTNYEPKTKQSAAVTVGKGAFTSTPAPTISGTEKVGSTLTAKPGTWTPAVDKFTYQWHRNGKAIQGATSATFTLKEADTGAQISVDVTGSKAGYTTVTETSKKTAKVEKGAYTPPTKSPFNDVATGYKFYEPIAWMYTEGLSTGVKTPNGRDYQPKVGVSREAMAAFLYRLEGANYKGPKVSPFADMQPGDKFYNEISWMYETGLSTGVKQASGDPIYAPKAKVSREAMAAFIYRLEEAKTPAPSASPFSDMNKGDKFYKEIAWMGTEGLSTGIKQPSGKPIYAPKSTVTREAMAAFLYRLETR